MKFGVALLAFASGCAALAAPDSEPKVVSDLHPSDSVVHYSYGRQYDYHGLPHEHHGYEHHGYAPSYEHTKYDHHEYHGYAPYHSYGHGHAYKHGYHDGVYDHYGYDDYNPYPHGYVPVHKPHHKDVGHGYAYGHDAVGHFNHHTGPYGPFGFYANFYHDL